MSTIVQNHHPKTSIILFPGDLIVFPRGNCRGVFRSEMHVHNPLKRTFADTQFTVIRGNGYREALRRIHMTETNLRLMGERPPMSINERR